MKKSALSVEGSIKVMKSGGEEYQDLLSRASNDEIEQQMMKACTKSEELSNLFKDPTMQKEYRERPIKSKLKETSIRFLRLWNMLLVVVLGRVEAVDSVDCVSYLGVVEVGNEIIIDILNQAQYIYYDMNETEKLNYGRLTIQVVLPTGDKLKIDMGRLVALSYKFDEITKEDVVNHLLHPLINTQSLLSVEPRRTHNTTDAGYRNVKLMDAIQNTLQLSTDQFANLMGHTRVIMQNYQERVICLSQEDLQHILSTFKPLPQFEESYKDRRIY